MSWLRKQILTHISCIVSVIVNTIASIMIITYNSSSKTYCETTYPDIYSPLIFDCTEGTDLQLCINDSRCYHPVDTFGFGYCTEDHDCHCCQEKIIHDTSIASIVFLFVTGILLIRLIYSIKLQSQAHKKKKPMLFMLLLLVITNIVYAILSVITIINMDIYSTAIWIIFLIINILSLLYVVWLVVVHNKQDHQAPNSNQSNSNAPAILKLPENVVMNDMGNYNNKYNQVSTQPIANTPPPAYNQISTHPNASPDYDSINKVNTSSNIQEIRLWFKQTIDLPTDDIDYNHKYCEMLIVNGFDTWKAIKAISNDDLIEIGINKLGHRKQIISAIKALSRSNEGQKITNM
eukprot:230257_1